jgi:hypothetical protein
MRKFHSIAALCGDGLRPELQALFDRLAIDPRSELFVRDDGMVQAGPDPVSETVLTKMVPHKKSCLNPNWQAVRRRSPFRGQSRHFDRAPLTSGFPQLADILRVIRHVSKVPTASFDPPPVTSGLPRQSGKHMLALSFSGFDPTET